VAAEKSWMIQAEQRLLPLLERLFEVAPNELDLVLNDCADLIGDAVGAEKVDAFLYDAGTNSLVALGTTRSGLAQLQKGLGLNRLPLANCDPMAQVYISGESYLTGAADRDARQPRGVVETMAVRSMLAVPLDVGGVRRGVISLASRQPERFESHDLALMRIVSHWVGGLVHRLELMEASARRASDRARRETAEELVTVLAHDLRNLLSPIAGRVELLHDRALQQGRDKDVRDCERVRSGLTRLTALMSDLLDVARIDRGMLSVQRARIDLVELVRACAASMTLPSVEIDVESFVPELFVEGDPQRLRQAFENVMSNATKHSPSGAAVTVQIEPIKVSEGKAVKIIVADRGPGIAEDVLPHIFDRYVSAGGSAGLGLGLYLARAVMSAHGGSIQITSSVVGTRCELMLPVPAN
jgi:two-component system OmpR family sensor kinase